MTQYGEIGILNVGAGDTKLSFDPANPADRERAAKIVADMLQRGFAILIEVGKQDGKPVYQRAEAFDAATCEYLIVGLPEDMLEQDYGARPDPKAIKPAAGTRPRRYRVPAEKTRAVSVARSAGG